MNQADYFWQIYLELEKETLEICKSIYIDDTQENVYSPKNADLILRINVVIESIAKELFLKEGGVRPDEDVDFFYDTVCIKFLEDKWTLSKKKIRIINTNIDLSEPKRILTPLNKASGRGTSGPKWKRDYQAIKHDRFNSIKKATVKNVLDSLAALFILNLYNRNLSLKLDNVLSKQNIDLSMGSNLFMAILFSDTSSNFELLKENKEQVEESIFIKHFDIEAIRKYKEQEKIYNEQRIRKVAESLSTDQEIVKQLIKGMTQDELQEEIKKRFYKNFKEDLIRSNLLQEVAKLPLIIELNKNQFAESK